MSILVEYNKKTNIYYCVYGAERILQTILHLFLDIQIKLMGIMLIKLLQPNCSIKHDKECYKVRGFGCLIL
jgi:hypothetical protein